MSKPIYLSLFFLAIILPFIFCQSDDSAGAGGGPNEPTSAQPESTDPSSDDSASTKPTPPTSVEQVKPTQPAPKGNTNIF